MQLSPKTPLAIRCFVIEAAKHERLLMQFLLSTNVSQRSLNTDFR